MNTAIDITNEIDQTQALFEELTKKYLLGEIQLDLYREEIANLKVRLDLRKMASKIKTGSLKGKLPE